MEKRQAPGDDRLLHSLLVAVITPLVVELLYTNHDERSKHQRSEWRLEESVRVLFEYVDQTSLLIVAIMTFGVGGICMYRRRITDKATFQFQQETNIEQKQCEVSMTPYLTQNTTLQSVVEGSSSNPPAFQHDALATSSVVHYDRDQSEIITPSHWISPEDEQLWKRVTASLSESQMHWLGFDIKVRFIRGSAFLENAKKREAYLKKRLIDTCAFRDKYRLDTILNRKFPFAEQFRNECWRMKIYGSDDEGNPIVYVPLAQHTYGQVKLAPYLDNILEYLAFHQECLLRAVRRRSIRKKEVVQPVYTAIFDLNGFGWRNFKDAYDCGFFKDVADLWAINYPDTMKRIYVINAPLVITAIMKLVSAFIEPDTLLKLRILGHTYLPKFESDKVPLSSLPSEIGGTAEGVWILPPENPKLDFD